MSDTKPIAVIDVDTHTGPIEYTPAPRWEKPLAFIASPVLALTAVGLLALAVATW